MPLATLLKIYKNSQLSHLIQRKFEFTESFGRKKIFLTIQNILYTVEVPIISWRYFPAHIIFKEEVR